MERQAATAAAAVGQGHNSPAPSVRAPNAAEGVGDAPVPVAAQPPSVDIPPAVFRSPTPRVAADEAERERGYTALTRFTKFHPPTFDGEVIDPWIVETWLASMETLFENIYTEERDKVNLAAHCFDKRARVWSKRVKQDRSLDLPPINWEEFRRLMFAEYFPNSDKRKMREDFRKLKQSNPTVREYEREFTHLLNCVLGMATTEQDRADCFVRGLRPGVFRTPPELQEDMSYEEFPVMILTREVRKLRNREIAYVRVRRSNHSNREATWELEEEMKANHPHLFED
uniref:Retrotransposon gag domain-containing protein n=1 Tax=Ananas comosus var. bracteatus TaxID=296719 RepID=A0A6V7PVB0_ANACO|nr:unnamed protein product [Ananas comosus var. bracteatus]